jgi:hypothetical protein
MVYVKSFDILGIDTAQIPCIELQGVPNSATVGAVGLLGMDVTSEGREIYVCTKVEGAIYTWQSLRDGQDGVSVIKSEINANGELILTLSNGNTLNAGVVKGEQGEPGKDGANGVSVTDAMLIGGKLVITLSNGTTKNLGSVIGTAGQDGVSIVNVELNASSELIITLSNDTVMNIGPLEVDYVEHASKDAKGNVIDETYAKASDVDETYAKVSDIPSWTKLEFVDHEAKIFNASVKNGDYLLEVIATDDDVPFTVRLGHDTYLDGLYSFRSAIAHTNLATEAIYGYGTTGASVVVGVAKKSTLGLSIYCTSSLANVYYRIQKLK